MKTHQWLPIRYRDFYDVPRAIIVGYNDALYFFDCPFSDKLDEYEDTFTVYEIPEELHSGIDSVSWADLHTRSNRVGSVPVGAVELDSTKRRSLNAGVFDLLRIA